MVSELSESICDPSMKENEDGEEGEFFDEQESRPQAELFAMIMNNESEGLEALLGQIQDSLDLTTMFNTSGFTLIHLAAYKS